MAADGPEYRTDVIDRKPVDRNAAYYDDAASLLDLVENPGEIGIERRMATVFRQYLSNPKPFLTELVQ